VAPREDVPVSKSDQIIVALLVVLLARSYLPPVGQDTMSNKVAIVLTQLAAFAFIGWTLG